MSSARRHWPGFFAWGLVGLCLALAVSQIGLFTVPPGLLLAIWLSRRGIDVEILGALEGFGAVSATVGIANLNYRPCPPEGLVLGPNQTSASCGGFDGTSWLVAGLVVMALVAAVYWRLGRARSFHGRIGRDTR